LAICERHFPILGQSHDMMEACSPSSASACCDNSPSAPLPSFIPLQPLLQEINRLYGVNHPNVMNCIRAAYLREGPTHPFVVITLEFMDRFSLKEVYEILDICSCSTRSGVTMQQLLGLSPRSAYARTAARSHCSRRIAGLDCTSDEAQQHHSQVLSVTFTEETPKLYLLLF
jgi:hypothetical protein